MKRTTRMIITDFLMMILVGFVIPSSFGQEPSPTPPPPRVIRENGAGPDMRVVSIDLPVRNRRYVARRGLSREEVIVNALWIKVRIQNIGMRTAENVRTVVRYEIEGRWVPGVEFTPIPRLGPGESKELSMKLFEGRRGRLSGRHVEGSGIPEGTERILVIVDPDNQIVEAREDNNEMRRDYITLPLSLIYEIEKVIFVCFDKKIYDSYQS